MKALFDECGDSRIFVRCGPRDTVYIGLNRFQNSLKSSLNTSPLWCSNFTDEVLHQIAVACSSMRRDEDPCASAVAGGAV